MVRGGGKNTVALIASKVKGDMVINNVNHPVRILASDGTTLNTVIAQNNVILDAPISLLRLESQADVTVQSKAITSMMVKASATGSRITVESGASIGTAVIEASKTSLLGGGQVTQVQVKGNEISVSTPGAQLSVEQGITGVKAGGIGIEGGKHVVVNQSGNGLVSSGNTSGSSSGGSF